MKDLEKYGAELIEKQHALPTFDHNVPVKRELNQNYVEVDRAIKDLGASLDVRLAKSKQDYMVNFTEEIKGKH